jgi:diguanylate cyclase (GGDEF)-like protein
LIGDIYFFKTINDRFSHAIGDKVLRAIAGVIAGNIRDADLAIRYGGEEFVIAFSSTPLPEAAKACDKLRHAIAHYPWQNIHPELKVTISMGLSAETDLNDHEQMIAAADKKLYEAKRDGKNCIRF